MKNSTQQPDSRELPLLEITIVMLLKNPNRRNSPRREISNDLLWTRNLSQKGWKAQFRALVTTALSFAGKGYDMKNVMGLFLSRQCNSLVDDCWYEYVHVSSHKSAVCHSAGQLSRSVAPALLKSTILIAE
ncbi:hypothetical protein CEXT_554421 [Caerostris extrusa]|uniref:Uncharacterized protein n=1 Tax=Caerostris extrusa TaxID=172846 RepID=A0AAV4NM32_CAEEX|nr:hypothetical protein CEXT_554421 [Caerostris extrusa]